MPTEVIYQLWWIMMMNNDDDDELWWLWLKRYDKNK